MTQGLTVRTTGISRTYLPKVSPNHRRIVDDLGVFEPHGWAVTSDAVTPLDLLFDLVYVFGTAQLSHHLLENPSWNGALETFVLLVAIFAL